MDPRNPYAPPLAPLAAVKGSQVQRDGDAVVVHSGSDLPPRCITCNAPVRGPVKEVRLYWHSPWLYLLILINILFYAIVGLIARRSVKVSPGLCEVHSAQRTRRILYFWAAGGAACVAGAVLLFTEAGAASAVFFVLAVLVLVIGMLSTRKVYAKKITKEYARVGGCKEPFLASLE